MTTKDALQITSDGTPVRVRGTGPTVIFIHGVLMDHRMWAPQVDGLCAQYRTCRFDMLGHGQAPDPDGERTLGDFVTQAHHVVRQFSEADRPVLCGFSMGGLIAQAYAAHHHERLAGLILLNTVHDRSPEEAQTVRARFEGNVTRGVENAVESGMKRWFTPADHEKHARAIASVQQWMRDGDFTAKRKAHRVFVTSDGEVTGKLGALSCPALIMTGGRDGGSTPAMAEKMAGAIPNAELHVLDDQHHMMPTLAADRVNRIIAAFLGRHT
ncbi:MAG: alpha/beta fold hydrolase [Pseudomonadota bacterium]